LIYIKRIETIKKQKEFNNIIKNGIFKKNEFYVIYTLKNNESTSKYGIAISNKIGKAFIRNRLKRRTRTIIDKNRNLFKNNNNYIIMIRKSCKEASYDQLDKALKALVEK